MAKVQKMFTEEKVEINITFERNPPNHWANGLKHERALLFCPAPATHGFLPDNSFETCTYLGDIPVQPAHILGDILVQPERNLLCMLVGACVSILHTKEDLKLCTSTKTTVTQLGECHLNV